MCVSWSHLAEHGNGASIAGVSVMPLPAKPNATHTQSKQLSQAMPTTFCQPGSDNAQGQ
jgi:hypothetical protein